MPAELDHPVAGIWREVLRLERVDPAANFFDLGGDSVAASRICAQAGESGYTLTLADVFTLQTLGSVLALLSETAGSR